MENLLQTPEFQKQLRRLSSASMGTEHMGPMLYAMIKFIRPHRILEIGSGLTTLFILAALKEISDLEKVEFNGKQSNYNLDFKNHDYYQMQHPKFCLHTFDNFKHPKTSAGHVVKIASELGLESFLKFWNTEYQNLPKVLNKDDQIFDMIWCDVGGLQNYVTQLNMLGPLLPNHIDGYLIFHSTLSNVHGLAFLNQIKLDILSGKMPNFEIMSFFEPHKNRQNSFTILRKKGELSSRIYSEQP